MHRRAFNGNSKTVFLRWVPPSPFASQIVLQILLAGLILVPPAIAQRVDVAVVVNSNNSVTNISLPDLRKIFAGQKHSWPGGIPIKIIARSPGCRERVALLKILGMSESEYKQYWTAEVIRGEADTEPPVVPSFGMVKEALKVYPGAIALADPKEIKSGMDIKIVRIEGHLPGETEYPIQ
jgi:ABC-type phosphate transport system substrate-binding protein